MKPKIETLLVFFLVGIVVAAGCISSNTTQPSTETGTTSTTELGRDSNSTTNTASYATANHTADITVEINPNLELFSVVYILAFNGSDPFIMAPKEYIQDVLTYFGPYNDSVVVGYVRDVFGPSLPYYTRDYSIMKFGNKLAKLEYLGNITNDSVLAVDLRLLSEFARESNFSAFYRAHLKEYSKATSNISAYINCAIPIYWRFFGKWYTKFRIEASYSVWIHPHASWENETSYYIGWISHNTTPRRLYGQVRRMFHEFAHPFVGEFLDENFQLFEGMDYYLDEIKKELPALTTYDTPHYGSFSRYLNELLTESIAKYAALKCGIPKDYMTYSTLLMSMYFPPLSKLLEEYDVVWKTNSTLPQYAPTLAEHMRTWATPTNISTLYWELSPVTWDHEWNTAFHYGRVVIVPGSSEQEREAAKTIKDALEDSYNEEFGQAPSIEIKAYDELTPEDTKANLILIGTPQTNDLVKELNDGLPVKFVFNGSWILQRDSASVKEFFSFEITNQSVKQLPLEYPTPSPWGVIETIRNPWNDRTYITVLAGTNESLIMQAFWRGFPSYVLVGDNYFEVGFYIQGG
ncbi:hypothetical protein, conserved [Thermococcus kodakarensis KOD1]|uniref:S-layer protein C-terminal domain-containing protein n=1 Tax=Thermococcus kodakarensis (strain ATCC BAA-918 / JCM 12380 / KOD1) TaxID=69014 RepID=Q5JFR3_THEKO|nr:DUF4932 domain-containing protein [Thermococcus kodakarensis]WCN28305.1 DUF4932 domain-containing protein [Thermococcus kodakarensis]WCN30600.1 DUF4932 domain-containing protein [Thermococcus kodakarensis]BAD84404.1 hypothetical protein, conserved [Thermococcus kodakarensis KOD1]